MWGSLAPHRGPAVTEPPALLQKQVCAGQYGPGMAELEQQIAELNILQNEIDDQGEQLGSLVGPVGEPGGCHIRGQPQPVFPVRAGARSAGPWG